MVFMSLRKLMSGLPVVAAAALVWPAVALADQPRPWEMGYQAAASAVMDQVESFHNLLLVIITAISVFVLALLLYVMVRFRESRNPTPSKTSHNTLIEVLWTVVPIMILVVIAIPSFKLLYFADRTADAQMTVKAVGHQWYWSYEYPDNGNFTFDSRITCRTAEECTQAAKGGVTPLRLLDTDQRVVVPVDTNVRLLITAVDVIHSWAMPAFGVKLDAVPGRLNETWFRAEREGVYYGQCSELCGVDHAFMPITVEVLSKDKFDAWVKTAQENFDKVETPAGGSAKAPAGAEKKAAAGRAAEGNKTAVELARRAN
jgi:cytochrome c oxidase subunit 2